MSSSLPPRVLESLAQHVPYQPPEVSLIAPGDIRLVSTLAGDSDPASRLVLVTHLSNSSHYLSCVDGEEFVEPAAEMVHVLPLVADGDWDQDLSLERWSLPDWLLLEPGGEHLPWLSAAVPMTFRVLPQQCSLTLYGKVSVAERKLAWSYVLQPLEEAPGRVSWQGHNDPRKVVFDLLFKEMRSVSRHANTVDFSDLDKIAHPPTCPCSLCTEPSGRVLLPPLADTKSR